MKRLLLAGFLLLLAVPAPAAAAPPRVLAIHFSQDVNPVTQDWLNGELGHTPLDFDENRLGASIRAFFAKGELQHTTVEHHPGLAFWLFAASSFLDILSRLAHGGVAPAALLPVEMYVGASRIANLFVAAATVGVTAFAGRRLAGSLAGLMAGLIVAVVPLSVETTTLCRCDPVMVLGVVVTLVLALRCLTEPRPSLFAAAGVIAGRAVLSEHC